MLVSDSGYVPEPFFLFETLRSQTSRFHDPLGDSLLSKSRNVEGFRKWSETQSRNHSKTRSRHDSPLRRLSPSAVAGGTGEPTSPVGSGSKRMPFPVSDTLHKRTKSHPLSTDQGPRDQTPSEKHPDSLQLFPSETSPPSPGPIPHSGPATLLVRSSRPIQAPPLYMMLDEEGEDGRGRHISQCKKIRENCYEMHLPSLVTPAASSAPGGNVKRIRYAVLEVSTESLVSTFC